MNLSTKLILLVLATTLIPMAAVGYLAFDNGRRTIERNVFHHLTSTNLLKEEEFDRWVRSGEASLRRLAQRPLVREYVARLASHAPSSGSEADPTFQDTYDDLIENHLNPAVDEGSEFVDLAIFRADDGLTLISTDPDLEGKYRESETYFKEGKRQTFVDNVAYSLAHGEAVMHISTPVRNQGGSVIGVLVGHADLREMSDIIEQRTGLSETEDTYLVNDFNYFVTEPRFGENLALKKAIHTAGVQDCLSGEGGTGIYEDYRGVPVLGAYRWMPDREMCILTEIDQAEAYAPIAALRNTVLIIGVGVGLAVAAVGALFARSLTRPVRHLVAGAEAIGQGDLDARIAVQSQDELGQLAEAFNQMAGNLAAIKGRLEQEIAEGKRREEIIGQQADEILDISTPVLQVVEGVVALPLIGTLDSRRAERFTDVLLNQIADANAAVALIDITGVPTIDTRTAQHLIEAIAAARLLGADVVLTGVRPAIAQSLVHLGIDLSDLTTRSSLSAGLQVAQEMVA